MPCVLPPSTPALVRAAPSFSQESGVGRTSLARSVLPAWEQTGRETTQIDGSVAKNERKSSCSSSPPPALLVSLLASN